jgi:tetracenomycin A2 monooxygenase-dioxygenase
MGYQYRSSVIVDDGGPDADPPGAEYTQSAAPGCRAPHLWIGDGLSTIDLFDRDLVLLTGPAGHVWRSAAEGLPVTSHVIAEARWPEVYGVSPGGAVLVRPDGHVAWRASSGDLRAAVSTALHGATDAGGAVQGSGVLSR